MLHGRKLGRTNLHVSPIGFGAFKIGRNEGIKYPSGYDLPSAAEVETLLHGVLDAGVTLIDTAPAYGLSEERIGHVLNGRRSEFVLSTKIGETFSNGQSTYDFSERSLRMSLERSLNRLQTDHLDLVFIHSPGDDLLVQQQTDAISVLQEYRARRCIGAIGMSGKTVAGALAALAWADVLMVEYHLGDTSHARVMDLAHQRDVGVLVKKPLGSGRLPASQAIPFGLNHPAVQSLVIGGLSLEHLRENLQRAQQTTVLRRAG